MDDADIVQLYWDRNEKAISVTAQKYGKYCSFIAMNILGNKEDADECVNDAYLRAWNSIPPNKPAVLSTFIGKLTRYLSINKYNYNHTSKRGGHSISVVLDELCEIVSDNNTVEQEFDSKELLNELNTFLSTLPAEKRNIFVCRYWYFESISDIAKRFNIKENNVYVILQRIRKQLHDYLTERGYVL